jgi:4-amino-4-deoxy-L-arabinose transferase-like glycosyltransferase
VTVEHKRMTPQVATDGGAAPGAVDRGTSVALAGGLVLGALALVLYGVSGYSLGAFALWMAAVGTLAVAFGRMSVPLPAIRAREVLPPVALALALAPLYLVGVYDLPVSVNTDELGVMEAAKTQAQADEFDPFGVTSYFGHAVLLLALWGKLAGLLGGVDVESTRLVHGAFGLLAVAASYAFFRQLLPRGWALVAAGLMGTCHSYVFLSRMALRENTVVLVEVVALALLLHGLRRRHALMTFCGGLVAGLGFYVYFPARGVFPIWLAFMACVALWFRREHHLRMLARFAGVAGAGFALLAVPVSIATLRAPPEWVELQRQALFLLPEGRELGREWTAADSELEGWTNNVRYGLSAFNNTVSDHAWNYVNPGHGFLDPITGVLLWVGVGAVVVGLWRRRDDVRPLLPLTGFVGLWLVLAFAVTKAPNYPRLLVTLPFVAYFATVALRALGELASRRAPRARRVVPGVLIAAVLVANALIASDYVDRERAYGDDIGSTGRFVADHRDVPGIRFFFAGSDEQPYFEFDNESFGPGHLRFFAEDAHLVGGRIEPDLAVAFAEAPPFALFMRRDHWTRIEPALRARHEKGRVENVTPDGRLVAFVSD